MNNVLKRHYYRGMNHLLEEYWEDLRWEALITWQRLNLSELNQVAGRSDKLERLIQIKYGFSIWESRKQIVHLIERYDNLAFLAAWDHMKEQLPKFWPYLTQYEINQIHGSRVRLLRTIKRKNKGSNEETMEEVNRFLRQFMD